MKRIIFSLSIACVLGFSSCSKDFFDINDNPNAPTETSMTPELLLPQIEHRTASQMATSYAIQGRWMGYWTRSGTYGASADEESYALTTSFMQTQWSTWYDILTDADKMEKMAVVENKPFFVGQAKVIKAIGFMHLVDMYNNVPYSKAFDIVNTILPSYDKGVAIYADLLNQLDEAAKLFATAGPTEGNYKVDVIFGAIPTGEAFSASQAQYSQLMWRKLANTMRLKLLVHQSQIVDAATVNDVVSKITADGSGFLAAGQSANVQPGYNSSVNQDNPFYRTFKVSSLGAKDQYNRANNFMLNTYRNNNDPRYTRVYSAAESPIGSNTYYGYNYGEVIANNAPQAANSSDVAGPGLAKGANQPQWLLTSVESLFLQAEATQRGWLAGNARQIYESAVSESFVWLGLTSTQAATYYTQVNVNGVANPVSNWDSSTDKITLIVKQKYISLTGVNNFEAWVDYRRLGVPADLPMSMYPGRGTNVIPLRLMYPTTEYVTNSANVNAEGTINGQTSKIFWDN